jgi:hypothetical protein
MKFEVKFNETNTRLAVSFSNLQMIGIPGGGGVDFTTDETLTLKNGVLSVNTTDAAVSDDPRPITAQGVYNEFAVLNALLKTI